MKYLWIVLAYVFLAGNKTEAVEQGPVKDGVLDLGTIAIDQPLELRGDWEFYWSQLYEPQTIESAEARKSFIQVPALWSQGTTPYPVLGFATYRLRVVNAPKAPIALYFPASIWSASRIFVEGREIARFGVVGTDAATSQGGTGQKLYDFTPQGSEFDIIVQVANFEIFLCGITQPIVMGPLEAIASRHARTLSIDLFIIGALFIMGMYHICLFLLRREDPSPICFGTLCLTVSLYLASARNGALPLFFPELGFDQRLRIYNLAWIAGTSAFSWFAYHSFRTTYSRFVPLAVSAITFVYYGLILGTDARIFVAFTNYFHAIVLMMALYSVVAIVRARFQKVEGASVFLFGVFILLATTVNDILSIRQLIKTPMFMGLGVFGFIFCQSYMLAMRFSKAFARVKTSEKEIRALSKDLESERDTVVALNTNLERIVDEKTRDIRSIMEHIPLGIFMIKSDKKIHKDHSRHIHEIFPVQDMESCVATDLIFSSSSLTSDDKSQAVSTIEASLGEHIVNFEANAHTLPSEFQRVTADGKDRHFELTWNAIEKADLSVDKILVTMRDVTDIRKLQELSKEQQEELQFIGEIISVPAPRFLRFIQSCRELIQENEKLIHSQGVERRNFEVLKLLFINMHTIKGSARSLYFKRMTRVFHDVEQYYAHLQKERQASWDVEKMARDLGEARKIVELYESLAREKLGRSSEQTHFVEFRIEHVEAIYRRLREATRGKELPKDVLASVDQIQTLFHHKIYKDANDVFHEIFGCLAVLAKDLHKEHPEVILETNGILLGEQADELFRNTFVHLLRNAMDHGIESSAERIKAGKPPKGTVSITMQRQDDIMRLTYQDDGRGLHMKKIFEIGLARGLLKAADAAHGHKIAGLIFDSGLSTANQVTDISGRGVGMDAVKRYIQECEGDIRIELLEDRKTHPDYCPFRFVVELPFHMFDDEQDAIGRSAA